MGWYVALGRRLYNTILQNSSRPNANTSLTQEIEEWMHQLQDQESEGMLQRVFDIFQHGYLLTTWSYSAMNLYPFAPCAIAEECTVLTQKFGINQ